MTDESMRSRTGGRRGEAERREAETDTIADSIENLDEAPPHPLLVVPRPMACGALVMSIVGAIVGGAIGFGIGAAIFGFDMMPGVIASTVAVAVAGFVAGGVFGGWSGGLGAKARDEQRPSYAGRAPGTRPVRQEEQPEPGEPMGWK